MKAPCLRRLTVAAWVRRPAVIPVLVVLLLLAGCDRKSDTRPPDILYGQTECDSCKMIISDQAFAAAAVIVAANSTTKLAFDDIGCLLDYRREHPDGGRMIEYVRDHDSPTWLTASQAILVTSENLHTPMASHVAACATEEHARALAKRVAGRTLTFDELVHAPPAPPAAIAVERNQP